METYRQGQKSPDSDPADTESPEVVLMEIIQKLDELVDDDVCRVLRALNAYYGDIWSDSGVDPFRPPPK